MATRQGSRPPPLLEVRGVAAGYDGRRRLGRTRAVSVVVEAIDLTVEPGECVGLVGESGSGKTTIGLCIAGLLGVVEGEIRYRGAVASSPSGRPSFPRVRGVQAVYQDPFSALNPRRTVGSLLREILRVHELCDRDTAQLRCIELVEQVGLDETVLSQRPRALSGGICQRVAITMALALSPELLIADEIVSSLDASVQAQVLNLLSDLRERTGIALLFISHDLAVVNQLCDRVIVLNRGAIVESGPTPRVLGSPEHEYTRSLIAAIPRIQMHS